MRENFTRGNGNFHHFNGFQGATFHFNGDEDFDPFDIFDMFFNGGRGRAAHNRRAAQRRNQHFHQEDHHQNHQNSQQHNADNQRQENRGNLFQFGRLNQIFQYFPFIILIVFTFLPYLKNSVRYEFNQKPYYSFSINEEYYKKQYTHINRIPYYVGDNFFNYYKSTPEIHELNYIIEREYLNLLMSECQKGLRQKQELEYKINYYRNYPNYVSHFEKELKKIDLEFCKKYNNLRYVKFS